ncbi:MAG: ribosome biogenesis GTPase Der [Pseudomonadota bacterium]
METSDDPSEPIASGEKPRLKVAIIGRPNVGKSTLFNRLVGRKLALVDDRPGVTRDRREGEARLGDLDLLVYDTAGLEEAPEAALESRMRHAAETAVDLADVILFLVDARAGVTPADESWADRLRVRSKPVVLAANKAEGTAGESGVYDAYALGFGEPAAISAEHGEGLSDLYEALRPHYDALEAAPEREADEDALKPLRVAIVGRPNAGKSTLVNRLIGEDRMLTGPEAGITRDAIGVEWRWDDGERVWPVKLFDTAGMRKKARVQEKLEKLSVADTLRAVRFAEVVVLLFDASEPFEKQDLQIADLIVKEGRAVVLAANKWDAVEERDAAAKHLRERARTLLPQIPDAPLVKFSALTGKGVDKLMPAVTSVYVDWNAQVKTSALNDWLYEATTRHPPPAVGGRRIKIRYIAQTKTRPPTFVAQCSRAADLPESYKRYLVNGIREAFDIPAVPIRLIVKKPDNPYAKS